MARKDTATTTFRPRVKRLGDHLWLVQSKSTPSLGHQVSTMRGTCSCPAGKRGLRTCWHRTLAATLDAAYAAWMDQGVAQRRAARPAGKAALMEAFGV